MIDLNLGSMLFNYIAKDLGLDKKETIDKLKRGEMILDKDIGALLGFLDSCRSKDQNTYELDTKTRALLTLLDHDDD